MIMIYWEEKSTLVEK